MSLSRVASGARASSTPARSPYKAAAATAAAAFFGLTFTVNSTGDGADNNPGDDTCNDGTGNCTLRA
ncbi:MAG TPA: hypothetical protein VHU19_10715, partial [Pyrinomonadaceae bacterium]|nr:hypothetical protein [Pyrinomonadaceae bacterium]